jgi:hypothetical protein
MQEPVIPSYYVIDRTADVSEMQHFLSFTPVYCVFITKHSDYEFALQFHGEVLITDSEDSARKLAEHVNKETGRCPIIIGAHTETIYANQEIEEEAKA